MEYEFLCKTFRCCIDEDCDNCPLYDFEIEHCEKQIKLQALAFIIRQQAEIEGLKADKEAIINGQLTLQKMYLESRAEAVREFAERLKELSVCGTIREYSDANNMSYMLEDMVSEDIDNLAKEMTEKEGGMDEISIDKHSAEMV